MVYVQLIKSNKQDKRYTALFYDDNRKQIKTTHFGSDIGSTFIDHKDEKTKDAWIARHKVRGTFNNYMSASALAKHLLWNKITLRASYMDYLKTFGLTKY